MSGTNPRQGTARRPGNVLHLDALLRPVLVVTVVTAVTVEFTTSTTPISATDWWIFTPVAILSLLSLAPTDRVPAWLQVCLLTVYAVLAALLFPLPASTFAPVFVFMAAAAAGQVLASRGWAIAVAAASAIACAATIAAADTVSTWPWWLGLTAGLPVFIGIARRQRKESLEYAQIAVAEAERASASEAREAALIERGRIAREIHDVLGHSLSAILIQLDLADALTDSNRAEEASLAVRRARSLARGGMSETRRAIHALQEDSLPLSETLEQIAENYGACFRISGIPTPLKVETAGVVIRATQECLTNGHRHASGASLSIVLDYSRPNRVDLSVLNGPPDHGPRRPAPSGDGTGIGLDGLRERATFLGGTFRAGPTVVDGMVTGWLTKISLPR